MPRQFESGHVLVAHLDLESRKTREERASESAAVLKHPDRGESIRRRGCLKKSLDLVEQVTRYLHAHGMTYIHVFCAYSFDEHRWKMLVFFRKTDLPAAAREAARGEILARFLGPKTPLEIDLAMESRKEVQAAYRAIAPWRVQGEWNDRTRLLMMEGRAREVEREDEVLLDVLDSERVPPEGSAAGRVPKWLRGHFPRPKKILGLPLELAIAKMRLPSEGEDIDTDM